ncbi:ComF family protein [Alkaliphilus pronyensis]|uniref:ComF family protein n=1 Tax=Alkaliphilus pronyensis TaxID=1482732 RepID=A0A6I0FA36_9FIRM|nr:ComF family protein [Alkaliphilus pronyensis]KAB3539680.1 ComF family protein [Alkaliphilus pronyensis]
MDNEINYKKSSIYGEYIKPYLDAFWQLIYPEGTGCIICKGSIETNNYSICNACFNRIVFYTPTSWMQITTSKPFTTRVFSVIKYSNSSKQIIYRFKYNHETFIAKIMANMMIDYISKLDITFNALVAVPLHHTRQKIRGFNQADLLSKYISKGYNIPNIEKSLIRVKNTKVMHHLSREERRTNIAAAFQVINSNEIANKDVLLIDDIVTTGATIEACCRALINAGAKSVTALTFARRTKEV